jgi:rod shape-determining protein MreC
MKLPIRLLQPLLLALIVIGLIALALSGYLSPVIRAVVAPVLAAQTWLTTRYQAIQSYVNTPEDLERLRIRNSELEAEVSSLQAEIIDLKQQVAETRILSALVEFARVNPQNSYQGANVIGRDTSPFMKYIIIDRGSDDNLRRGMPVVTAKGLVGRISAVLPNAARVQLITDSASNINVRIEPSLAAGVLQGQVTGNVVVDMIPKTASVNPGDLVLTSGLGGNYPPNLIIGQVTGVRSRENDLFQRASVQTAVDFEGTEIVLVITNFQPIDTAPLIPTDEAP